jgi:hypothetical protein
MEMQQTHYYTTGTATLPWKCNMVHRSCYQGKPNMSQYYLQAQSFYSAGEFAFIENSVILEIFKKAIIS